MLARLGRVRGAEWVYDIVDSSGIGHINFTTPSKIWASIHATLCHALLRNFGENYLKKKTNSKILKTRKRKKAFSKEFLGRIVKVVLREISEWNPIRNSWKSPGRFSAGADGEIPEDIHGALLNESFDIFGGISPRISKGTTEGLLYKWLIFWSRSWKIFLNNIFQNVFANDYSYFLF